MRTIDDLEISAARLKPPRTEPPRDLLARLESRKWLVIMFTVALAFSARAYQLGAASLAEDEANKVFAMRAYERGDFTVNAEHPMVMKMLCYASTRIVAFWNGALGDRLGLSLS